MTIGYGDRLEVATVTAVGTPGTQDYLAAAAPAGSTNLKVTSTTNTTFNGAKGISWTMCFTLTSGSHSVPAAASIFAGANASGSVYYVVMVLTRQDNLQAYLNVTKPVLQGVHWKLS